MLTLNEQQWSALQAHDARQFVAAVCDQFLDKRPDMAASPGRPVMLGRMQAASDYAARIGFTRTPHVVYFMHLSADAPQMYSDPVMDRCLRKPGATPEQRLDDVMAVMRNKSKDIA